MLGLVFSSLMSLEDPLNSPDAIQYHSIDGREKVVFDSDTLLDHEDLLEMHIEQASNALDELDTNLCDESLKHELLLFSITMLFPMLIYTTFRFLPWLYTKYILQKVSEQSKSTVRSTKATNRTNTLYNITRLHEDVALLIIYTFNVVYVLYNFIPDNVLYSWIVDGTYINSFASTPPLTPDAEWYLRHFIYYQCVFYICLFFVGMLPPTSSDWLLLELHHVSALSLILSGYIYGHERTCVLVLVAHDICDVFLQLSRLTNRQGHFSREIFFTLFVCGHFCFRVILFPFIVATSFFLENSKLVDYSSYGILEFSPIAISFTIFCMHCYWLFLSLKKVHVYFTQGVDKASADDPRDQSSFSNQKKSTIK